MTLRRAITTGAVPGMLLFLILFAVGTYSLSHVQSNPDPDTQRVMERYAHKIYLTLARIGLVHLWTGLLLGSFSGLVVRFLYPQLQHRVGFSLLALGVLGWTFFYFTARLLIRQPTFYDQFLFAQGGAARRLQVFLTDEVGLFGLNAIAGILGFAALLTSRHFRELVPRRTPWTRRQLVFVLLLATTALGISLRWVWSPPRPERPDRPNILVLSADSLRPDHMSFEGYHRLTTPNIDRLAARSRVFRQAYVPLARTLPSWTTFLTSTQSHTHGIRHMFPESSRRRIPLPTLAEELGKHGYRSGVVSDFAGEMFDLIDYGFDLVDTPPASHLDVLVERQMLLHYPLVFPFINHRLGKRALPVISYLTINSDAKSLAHRALRRMRELSDGGPFFLTVFFSTSHAPYASPDPFYRKFTDPAYDGIHRYAYGIRDPRQFREGDLEVTREDKEQIVALYDGAIAAVDDAIGVILEELEEWEFLDSTLVVVTADHGEDLFEGPNHLDHGKWFRGGDHANHIPWILFDPTGELGVGPIEEPVQSLDFMPTLLSRLGFEVPSTCQGVDLVPALRQEEPFPHRPFFAETGVWLKAPSTFEAEPDALLYPHINDMLDADPFDDSLLLAPPYDRQVVKAKHRMVRDGKWKLTYEPTRSGARYRLFDVERDPLNRQDVAEQFPEQAARLRAELRRWMDQDRCRVFDGHDHLSHQFTDLADG